MRRFFSWLMVSACFLCSSQSELYAQSTSMHWSENDIAKRSELLPLPPDAGAFARYGGTDVSLATGAINKSIALQGLQFKELSVPIGLNYYSNGIEVNSYASRVGLGWTLQAGGAITRVIYGRDDFNSNRRVPSTNYSANQDDLGFTNFCWQLTQYDDDSQPDVFTYSFNGISGKFIFDHQGNIVQMPVTANKIIRNSDFNTQNVWTFQVVTPDGTKYYFGGANAKEQTRKEGAGSPNFSTNFSSYMDNVWHVNKIEHSSGYAITFHYTANAIYYKSGVSDNKYKGAFNASEALVVTYVTSAGPQQESFVPIIPSSNTTYEYIRTNGFLLSRIEASDGSKVTFSYSSEGYPDKLVTAISYASQDGIPRTHYKLVYSVGAGSDMPFLTNISEYNTNDQRVNQGYQFDYLNKNSLPARVSFSQDHWGYYNGKYNAHLVPAPDESYMQSWFAFTYADRTADPAYGGNGLLTSINYPTGGKDEITYEGNTITESQDVNFYAEAYRSLIGTNDNAFTESAGVSFQVGYENKVTIKELCEYIGTGQWDQVHHRGKVIIRDANNAIVFEKVLLPSLDIRVEEVTLATGSYTLHVAVRGTDIRMDGTLRYRTGTSPNMQNVTVPVGGMRVKKVLTYESTGAAPQIKRLYYSEANNLSVSSGRPVIKPRYFRYLNLTAVVQVLYEDPGQLEPCEIWTKTWQNMMMTGNALNHLDVYNGTHINYSTVTESFGGDNFENGAIEHKYHIVPDIEAQPIRGEFLWGGPLTNTSYPSGREEETTVFQKKNNQLLKVERTKTEYTDETRRRQDIVCWTVFRRAPLPCVYLYQGNISGSTPYVHESFDAQKYYLSSVWSYPHRVTKTVWDVNEQNPLTTVTDLFYENENHLQVTKSEQTNSKGIVTKTTVAYPHEFVQTGNVYERMVARNIIAPQVEVKSYNATQLLLTQTTNYKDDWFTDKHLVAIGSLEQQKTGYTKETRFTYHKYSTDGLPLEVSKAGDIKQFYLWDYKDAYPVAQVINADAASVAYTSFEADSKGSWTFTGASGFDLTAPTGRRAYLLSGGSLVKTGLDAGKMYTLSYWSKSGLQQTVNGTVSVLAGKTLNGWKYFEHKVSGSTQYTLSGSANVDEVRLYPEAARMTTSTYEPGLGLTSQCDANNTIIYYEYDDFRRLTLLRDEHRNILKKYCYNFQQQVEDCTTPTIYWNEAQSQNFTRNNCPPGQVGTTIAYAVPAGKYKSTISLQDANAKALAEISANGQANANQLGTCITCSGNDKKVVNGVCETGIRVLTGSTQLGPHYWQCTYHYEWSDGSWSPNYVEESTSICDI
jgi:hypothetical protein